MTITLALLGTALIWFGLWAEERSWQRRQAERPVPQVRCLVCPGGPMVDDFRTHTALVHSSRVVGPEDAREWASS